MTTPDPIQGAGEAPRPAPDDATSTYDAAPWPAEDPADPTATAPEPAPESPASPWPPTVSWPPAGSPGPSASPAPATAGWSGSAPAVSSAGSTQAPTPSGAARIPAGTPPPVPPVGSNQLAGASPAPGGAYPAPGSVPPPGYVPPGYGPGPSWTPASRVPPQRTTPSGLVGGVILVIIGAALLLERVVDISLGGVTWPLWIVVPGVAMLVGSFFIPPKGGVGLAIPGTIITIVGLILWVQEAYNLYATWAYAWALVAPTGPGLGMLLYGIVHRDGQLAGDGFRTVLVGLGLFLGFALFFEGVIGLSGRPIANLDQVLPYGIIGLGVLLVALSFFGGTKRGDAPRAR